MAGGFTPPEQKNVVRLSAPAAPAPARAFETGAGNITITDAFSSTGEANKYCNGSSLFERIREFCRKNDISDAALEVTSTDRTMQSATSAAGNSLDCYPHHICLTAGPTKTAASSSAKTLIRCCARRSSSNRRHAVARAERRRVPKKCDFHGSAYLG